VTVTLRPRLFELVLNVMLRALTGAPPGHGGDVRGLQEIIEETFAVTGIMNVGDYYPALRWVDRLRGVDAALIRLQARRDAFVAGLVQDKRQSRRASGPDTEKKSTIDELLALQETDPEYYTDTVIKGIVSVSSLSCVTRLQSPVLHMMLDASADTAQCRHRHIGANP
jgi:hypothetical protein